MQAIILAAGMGSRLKEKTEEIPKALIPINGTPLIINTLNILSNYNISEVIIVVGYLKEKIKSYLGTSYNNMKITYVDNNLYKKSNNIYSLFLTRDYIKEDILLLECDIYFSKKLLEKIVNEEAACNIMVSKYNSKTMNGTVVKIDDNKNVKELIVKNKQDKNFKYNDKYKTVNIYKFSKDFFLKKFIPTIDLYIKTESMNSYYEFVLGALIYYGNDEFKAVIVDEKLWREVDDKNDLEIAERTIWI